MATAEVTEDGRIRVATDFSERNLINRVPGARWDGKAKVWHAPLSWAACKTLRGVFGGGLVVGGVGDFLAGLGRPGRGGATALRGHGP